MQLRNSINRYGVVAKSFHWVMAVLILGMLALGLYMTDKPITPDILKLYGLHKAFGVVVLALVCGRFLWRLYDAPPPFPPMPRMMQWAAQVTHGALYVAMVALPLSGWAMSSAAGFPVSVFGWFTLPALMGPDKIYREIFEDVHGMIAYGLMGLLCLHVAAALWHHFVRKDGTLRRMLMGVALLCVSMSAQAESTAIPAYVLVPEKSSLGFTATQNNAPVEGEFKHFAADIHFDPKNLDASAVTVEVDMKSVASGYAEMAKTLAAPEWFDVAHFPTAVLRTTKIHQMPSPRGESQDYYAEATLTLRGKTVPLEVNFSFEELSPEKAIAVGKASLLRNAFGVGQGEWAKTDALRDNVMVHFRVVAVRKQA